MSENLIKETRELDVLAICTHPDDAELTVAGTLLKLKSLGYRTGVLDVTRGEMGTRGTVEERQLESDAAARVLNLDLRRNLGLPDGHVHADDSSRVAMVRALRSHKPKVLLTHHWDDPHPDHAATAQLVREAARLASMRRFDEEAGQATIPVPATMYAVHSRLVVPSFIVDISDFLENKMNSIRAHTSQFFQEGSDQPATRISDRRFLDEIEARSRYYGSLIGVAAGEPFYVREALNVDDPVALLTRPRNIYS
jgi:bacillithiol biosynthesis deacetylase BshB1